MASLGVSHIEWGGVLRLPCAIALNGVETTDSQGNLDGVVQASVEDWGGNSRASYPQPPRLSETKPWEDVALSPAWLEPLTPSINGGQIGQTTLSSLLGSVIQASNLPSFHGWTQVDKEFGVFVKIGTVVAGFVANGMSRTGWKEHDVQALDSDGANNVYYGYVGEHVPGWKWQANSLDQLFSQLIKGRASLIPNCRRGEGNTYKLDVTVKGYGFKAIGTAYWLALAVLFVYLSLVMGHVAYTVYRRRVSKAWGTATDFVVLSQFSDPPKDGMLKHCSSGVKTHKVSRVKLRIRAFKGRGAGEEELQLVVGQEAGEKVEFGRCYGAIP